MDALFSFMVILEAYAEVPGYLDGAGRVIRHEDLIGTPDAVIYAEEAVFTAYGDNYRTALVEIKRYERETGVRITRIETAH